MRSVPAISLLALLLIPASQAQAVPDLVQTLPNKVTVIVREVHTRPLVSIQAWVRAGTRDEALKDRGLAVATAQCILDATPKRESGAIQKELYAIAGTYDESREVIDRLNALGISYDDVIELLEVEGVQKFEDSYAQLSESVRGQLDSAKS